MPKRDLGYYVSLLPALVCITGNALGGVWTMGNVVFSLIGLGILETLSNKNHSNDHSSPKAVLPELLLLLHVVLHTLVLFTLFRGIYLGQLQGIYLVFAVLSCGVEAGSGAIIVAHELVHKASGIKRILGQYLLLSCGNYYFYIHHLRVHHRFVGTDNDAATAKKGESLYRFYMRTVMGQSKEAWNSEKIRLGKKGISEWSVKNIMVQNVLALSMIALLLGSFWGLWALGAWMGLVLVSNFLLEYVNYIEHYGLTRKSEERVSEVHSWNCDKSVSRFMLIDLSRHADHHFFASKPYHTLNTHANAPSMPGGYVSMVLPALVPRWWFKIMHPILDSLENRELSN